MLNFTVLALATWRITSIIQAEEIMRPLRRLFGVRYDEALLTEVYPDTFMGKLIKCFWCVSVWCGLACTLIYFADVRILYPFAASASAILLDKIL